MNNLDRIKKAWAKFRARNRFCKTYFHDYKNGKTLTVYSLLIFGHSITIDIYKNKHNRSIEAWKPIKDYEDCYEISTYGRIRTLERVVGKNQHGAEYTRKSIIKKPSLSTKKKPPQYHYVYLSKGGEKKAFKIHRLVAEHFVWNVENKPLVLHYNGNSLDNFYLNLYWGTHSDNAKDRERHKKLKSNQKNNG